MDIKRLLSFSKQIGTVKSKRIVPAAPAKRQDPSAPMKDASTGIENRESGTPPAPVSLPKVRDLAVLRKQLKSLSDTGDGGADEGDNEIPPDVKAAIYNLRQALDPLLPEGDTTKLAGRIKVLVENCGLYFEKRLEKAIETSSGQLPESMKTEDLVRQPGIRHLMATDVKPNLLILKQFLDKSDQNVPSIKEQPLETMKRVVSKMLDHMEQQQQSAIQRPGKPELLQAFTHMMVLTGENRDARLKVYYAKKGRPATHDTQPRISLLLEMDRMGTVRADLWMAEGNLNITFYVQDEKAKRAVENEQKRIGGVLANTFTTVSVGVVISEKKIAAFEGEDLKRTDHRQLDVTV